MSKNFPIPTPGQFVRIDKDTTMVVNDVGRIYIPEEENVDVEYIDNALTLTVLTTIEDRFSVEDVYIFEDTGRFFWMFDHEEESGMWQLREDKEVVKYYTENFKRSEDK